MSTSPSLLTPALISSVPELVGFLSSIPSSSTLYLDLEGKNLSRNGTISIITILIYPQKIVYLIDILALGERAFTTISSTRKQGKTFKSIFEDPGITKCF
jgi:exonuclease 3'-5' domain-containing protein 1